MFSINQSIVHQPIYRDTIAVGCPANLLASTGAEFVSSGEYDNALTVLDTALSMINSVSTDTQTWSAALDYIIKKKSPSKTTAESIFQYPADLYLEDECDVGPRILRSPIVLEALTEVGDYKLLELVLIFNKGLAHHLNGHMVEAKKLYELVSYSVQNMLALTVGNLPVRYLELAFRSHNNLGQINYFQQKEEISLVNFGNSIQFGRLVVAHSKAFGLEYATTLSNWCRVGWMRGDISDVLYHNLSQVLGIRSSLLSWNHADVAAARYNLAVVSYARRDNEKAVEQLMQYLAISRQQSDLDSIPALIYLLLIQYECKDDKTAQDLVRGLRSLQEKRHEYGSHSSEVTSLLNYVGTILFHQEDYENALVFFQEELRLEEETDNMLSEENFSIKNTSVSVTCNNIGRILQELGRLEESVTYYNRALEHEFGDIKAMSARVFKGNESLSCNKIWTDIAARCDEASANLYSTVWYNLGLIHDKQNNFNDAIRAFQMSLELRKILLGSNHPDIACLLYNIGVLQMEQQRLDEASASFREALRIRRTANTGQLNDTHLVSTLQKLASLHNAKGNVQSSIEATEEVLRIQELSNECDTLTRCQDVGSTLQSLAELYHAVGDLSRAIQLALESVNKLRIVADLSTRKPGPTSSANQTTVFILENVINVERLVSSFLLLGSLYHETNEPIEAHAVFVEAYGLVEESIAATKKYPTVPIPSSLYALQEVTKMLCYSPCAAEA